MSHLKRSKVIFARIDVQFVFKCLDYGHILQAIGNLRLFFEAQVNDLLKPIDEL